MIESGLKKKKEKLTLPKKGMEMFIKTGELRTCLAEGLKIPDEHLQTWGDKIFKTQYGCPAHNSRHDAFNKTSDCCWYTNYTTACLFFGDMSCNKRKEFIFYFYFLHMKSSTSDMSFCGIIEIINLKLFVVLLPSHWLWWTHWMQTHLHSVLVFSFIWKC